MGQDSGNRHIFRNRHIFPGTTLDNLLTERCTLREFAGKMSQSPARAFVPYRNSRVFYRTKSL